MLRTLHWCCNFLYVCNYFQTKSSKQCSAQSWHRPKGGLRGLGSPRARVSHWPAWALPFVSGTLGTRSSRTVCLGPGAKTHCRSLLPPLESPHSWPPSPGAATPVCVHTWSPSLTAPVPRVPHRRAQREPAPAFRAAAVPEHHAGDLLPAPGGAAPDAHVRPQHRRPAEGGQRSVPRPPGPRLGCHPDTTSPTVMCSGPPEQQLTQDRSR